MKMDTDSLYLALAENSLYDCIQEDKKEVWEFSAVRTAMTILLRIPVVTSPHARAGKSTRSMTRESQDFLKRSSAALKCCVFVAKRIVAVMQRRTSKTSVAKD